MVQHDESPAPRGPAIPPGAGRDVRGAGRYAEPAGRGAGEAGRPQGPARPARERTRMFAEGTGPAADPAGARPERPIRSFQPRRSRITAGQTAALRRLWPAWGIDVDGRHMLDPEVLFEGRPVVLEIGFGMGEATARMAADDPDTGILAVDVHTPGQGRLLALAERHGLSNIRVANGDAVILLRDMLPPASLAGLRVYFPDPWPKKRHRKRRLIQPDFVTLAATRLTPGALLHCATDWEPYAEQMLDVLTAHPGFENTQAAGGFAARPAFRPRTRFEAQGLDRGHVVRDLLFRRTISEVEGDTGRSSTA